MKPTVDLCWGDNLGLILPWPSGVIFTNQVAGYACHHPEIEGIFVPLNDGEDRSTRDLLAQHFTGAWTELEIKDADLIDRALQEGLLGFISVNRERLLDSKEAWVHVNLDLSACGDLLAHFPGTNAILTWENSD